jgi:outer membrane protein TolC
VRQGAGRGSELEVIRAEVSRDNLRPQLVQAQNSLDLARLNLKRLVEIPLDQPIRLTTPLTAPTAAELRDQGPASELLLAQRASVQAAERQVSIREQQVRLARSAFLPSVAVQSNFSRQITPPGIVDFGDAQGTGNWTVALGVSVPIFNGLARNADLQRSRVELEQARTQVAQLREAVELQYEQARAEKERARAAITTRQRTTELAERAYNLTVLRFEEGVATQLDVSTARLELNQARTNLAQAIAEFYLADAGVARAGAGGGATGVTGTVPNAPANTPGTVPTTAPASTPGTAPTGAPATTTIPTPTTAPTTAQPGTRP